MHVFYSKYINILFAYLLYIFKFNELRFQLILPYLLDLTFPIVSDTQYGIFMLIKGLPHDDIKSYVKKSFASLCIYCLYIYYIFACVYMHIHVYIYI